MGSGSRAHTAWLYWGFGTLYEIELVLVVAEPGDPFQGEQYDAESSPVEYIDAIAEFSFHALERRDMFSTNFRHILGACWEGLPLYEQMRRTWEAE